MRQSFWKLTALVGISGLGFLVLLQVQKNLRDSGVAHAAEIFPESRNSSNSDSEPFSRSKSGSRTFAEDIPERSAAPAENSGGLDFRGETPSETADGLVRTAEPELQPIPQRTTIPRRQSDSRSAPTSNPFAEVDAPAQSEPKPAISPAGFDSPFGEQTEPAAEPAKPASESAEPSPFGDADFGPDPFADFDSPPAGNARPATPATTAPESGAPEPDASAAEFAEPPAMRETPSPARQLESDDPFGASPAAESPANAEPASESPAAMPAQSEPAIEEGANVPIDGSPAPKEAAPSDFGDDPFNVSGDPFADSPAPAQPEPAPASDEKEPESPFSSAPTSRPVTPEPMNDDPFGAEPASPEPTSPAPTTPTTNASPSGIDDDPFGDSPAPAQPSETVPVPGATVPVPENPAVKPSPETESPRLLPDGKADDAGFGTVSPDAPSGPQQARLTVEKKAPERAALRQPLIYEIVVTNVGESPAHKVTVSDAVPKGTQLEGTIPQAEMKGKNLVWNLDTLEPGQTSTIKIKVTPIEPGTIGSVATVNFVSEVAARTQIISPQLALKITAPPQVALGQPVDIRFDITNDGSAPAEEVLLRDILPEGFQHADGNDLEYEVGTLAAGATETVTLRVASIKAGEFTNKAVITAAGGMSAEDAATIEVANRKVLVTRQGPKRRYVGRPAMYANVVKNASNEIVPGVKVLEVVPQGMEFVQASHGGQFNADTRTVAWQLGALRPGQEQTVQVTLTATEEGVQDSTVTVEELKGGSIQLTSSTEVSAMPSLAPSMEGPRGPIVVGERTAYRVTIRNRGRADATGIAVSLALPPNVRFVEARGGEATVDSRGVAAVRLTDALSPGGQQIIELVVEGTAPGTASVHTEVRASHMEKPLVRDEQIVVNAAQQ